VSALTVWLIRHGESTANIGPATDLYAQVPLTERGNKQAWQAAQRVIAPPDLIVSSPFVRACATAAPIQAKWPAARYEIWPIEEFTYLSPRLCRGSSQIERQPWVDDYWQRLDIHYIHGPEAESFAHFADRLRAFHIRLQQLSGFIVVAGHGQFFQAYLLGYMNNFKVDAKWMKEYRAKECANPIKNGEIKFLKLR